MTLLPSRDYEEAREVGRKLFEGIGKCDSTVCKSLFFENAFFCGASGDNGNIQPLFDAIDNGNPGPKYKFNVDVVALVGNIACVQVLEEQYNSIDFTCYLTMVKHNGEWKIVSFVSHTHTPHLK